MLGLTSATDLRIAIAVTEQAEKIKLNYDIELANRIIDGINILLGGKSNYIETQFNHGG